MNKLLRPIAFGVLLAGLVARSAWGQDMTDPGVPIARPFQAGVGLPVPARVWIGGNAVGQGVGYLGSYYTGGMVANLGEDFLDGYWVLDARAHISQAGKPFSNIGFVRGLAFEQLGADFRTGIFYDFDADKSSPVGTQGFDVKNRPTHTFHQIGVTGELLNDFWELRGNGYFPVANSNFVFGTPGQGFINNNILLQNGVDSALQGFDVRGGIRPTALQPWSGLLNVGGYYYRSETVAPFGGVMGGLTGQPIAGMTAIAQITHDPQFKTTGLLALQLHFGGSRGQSGGHPTREAEPVRRNDHIVRVHQDPILATNPATGVLWHVIHVDNSAPPGGDGSFEHPFNSLAAAQAASNPNDIIFVREGLTPGGNLAGMNTGIVLKDNQQFLGDGVAHFIPTVERGIVQLKNDLDGILPTISNVGGNAVTLANGNTVSGFNIINSNFGIHGGAATAGAIIQDNIMTGMTINGVQIGNASGLIDFARNTINTSGADGINIVNSTGTINSTNDTLTANGLNGISITNSTGTVNVTTDIIDQSAQNGVLLTDSSGTLNVTQSLFTRNVFAGVNVSKSNAGLLAANITNNRFGNPFVLNPVAPIPPTINNFGNGTGIISSVTGNVAGVGNQLITNISNNQINNSLLNGIQVASGGGANHTVQIANNPNISNNGLGGGGTGVVVNVSDGGAVTTIMNASITNNVFQVNAGLAGAATDIQVSVVGNAQIPQLTIGNNTITGFATSNASAGAMHFSYAANNTLMNLVDITNNTMGTGVLVGPPVFNGNIANEDGIHFDVSGTTNLSVLANGNSLSGNGTAVGGDGFDLRGTDTSLTQFQITNNQITGFRFSGIQAAVFGTGAPATMLVEAFSNNIVNNNVAGAAFAGGVNLEIGQIAGVAVAGAQVGNLIARLKNDIITPNGGPGALPANTLATIGANTVGASTLTLQMANDQSNQGIALRNLAGAGPVLEFEDGGGNTNPSFLVAPFIPVGNVNFVGIGTAQAAANAAYTFPPFRALLLPTP